MDYSTDRDDENDEKYLDPRPLMDFLDYSEKDEETCDEFVVDWTTESEE
jgi:hypothetical protein